MEFDCFYDVLRVLQAKTFTFMGKYTCKSQNAMKRKIPYTLYNKGDGRISQGIQYPTGIEYSMGIEYPIPWNGLSTRSIRQPMPSHPFFQILNTQTYAPGRVRARIYNIHARAWKNGKMEKSEKNQKKSKKIKKFALPICNHVLMVYCNGMTTEKCHELWRFANRL